MYEAKVILDSVNEYGQRLITVEATYPRIIHSELLTHRAFARNAASSRAIPWAKMSERIRTDPFVPIAWGAEQSGMQTGGAVDTRHEALARSLWALHRDASLQLADLIHNIGRTYDALCRGDAPLQDYLAKFGFLNTYRDDDIDTAIKGERVHKSIPNRLTEAHAWITTVISATDWKNFFALRCHPQAEVHFQVIAEIIRDVIGMSTPTVLPFGSWHLPYIGQQDRVAAVELFDDSQFGPQSRAVQDVLREASVARCARLSYLTHDGKRDLSKDLELYDRLRNPDGPPHASPMEHTGMSATPDVRSGPFRGWLQHRKQIANECADN